MASRARTTQKTRLVRGRASKTAALPVAPPRASLPADYAGAWPERAIVQEALARTLWHHRSVVLDSVPESARHRGGRDGDVGAQRRYAIGEASRAVARAQHAAPLHIDVAVIAVNVREFRYE